MSLFKQTKDWLSKFVIPEEVKPSGLVELNKYFRLYGPIHFEHKLQEDGSIVAISSDFKYGSIIAHAKSEERLETEIVDAILTSFEVPSSYAREAQVQRVGKKQYAFS